MRGPSSQRAIASSSCSRPTIAAVRACAAFGGRSCGTGAACMGESSVAPARRATVKTPKFAPGGRPAASQAGSRRDRPYCGGLSGGAVDG